MVNSKHYNQYNHIVNDNELSNTTFDTIMRHIDANIHKGELLMAA